MSPRDAQDQDEPPKDRFFNPHRIPSTTKSQAIVDDVLKQVQNFEKHFGLRKRKRKASDQKTFEATVTAIVCDLMHHLVSKAVGGVAITRSNQTLGSADRYRHPALNKTLPRILDNMARPEMAFVEQDIGSEAPFTASRMTTIKCGQRLLSHIGDNGVTAEDFKLQPYEETIVLKRNKEDYWDSGEAVEYEDTTTTKLFRTQMNEINSWIADAELEFDKSVLAVDRVVDTHDRQLRRIFSRGSFESGGRLFGGFWQNISKQLRTSGIIINGEDVSVLDYSQMNPRILYGLAKAPLPEGDLYTIPGFEAHREGIKKVMNSMVFSEKPLTRFPKDTRKLFTSKVRFSDVVDNIEAAHPALRPSFYTGIGHHAMFIESRIMVDLLLDLKEQEIVALPIHDAVVVPLSRMEDTRLRMLSTFHHHTGVHGMVSEE